MKKLNYSLTLQENNACFIEPIYYEVKHFNMLFDSIICRVANERQDQEDLQHNISMIMENKGDLN